MAMTYNLNKIRTLLTEGFTAEELRRFCYDESDFRPVYYQLAANTGKAEIIDRLLEYAEQKRLVEKLLAWTEEQNPDRYREGQPYIEAVTSDSARSRSDLNNPPKTTLAPSKKESHPSSAEQIEQLLTASVDFLIITPLEEERDALLKKLPNPKKLDPFADDIHVYFESNLPLASGNGSYRIVVMPLLGMGRVQAATATNDAIRRWTPRYVILVGIAGGVAANNVKFGDVLIPNEVVDYELQKQTAIAIDIRWKVYNVSPRLLAATQNFLNDSWSNLIQVKRPQRGQPKRHIGPIASGDKVIDFAQTLDKYRETWSKLIGVEMEAGGVAASVFQAAKQTEFFMIRGVSDLADGDKNAPQVRKWRPYACDVAASYTIAWLRSGPVTLSSASGDRVANKQKRSELGEERQPAYSIPSSIIGTPKKSIRARQVDPTQRCQILWQTQTTLKSKHFFAGPDYLCLVTSKALHFFSTNDGTPLLPPLTTFGDFSLENYVITGGDVASSGSLLLTLLPHSWSDKACLLALELATQGKTQLLVKKIYEARDAQLSAPMIDHETIYFIQSGPELVMLDSEYGVQHTVPLSNSYDLHKDCVSLAFAANRLCLALCDGTILALEPKTGQILTTLREDPNRRLLSPLATDGWWLFFGMSTAWQDLSPSRVCALDIASGQEKWNFELPLPPSDQRQLIKGWPLVINNMVCMAGGNCLRALDIDTGQELWNYQMPHRLEFGPIWTGKAMIVVDWKGNVHALQFGEPEFVITYHYDLRTPPTFNEWHSLIFTLVNSGCQTAHNTILRLRSDEFKGISKNHTQELSTIAPRNVSSMMRQL